MANNIFMQQLIQMYSEDDVSYTEKVNQLISQYFDALKPSTSKIDPRRLGTRSVFISQLRKKLLATIRPLEYEGPKLTKDQKLFNKMNLTEQLKFQFQSVSLGKHKWVDNLDIMPNNIVNIEMSQKDKADLSNLRGAVDTGKLKEEMTPIDVDTLMNQLLPSLTDPNAKLSAVVAALLLATGRRTVEILKTADFYLATDQETTGYAAVFRGQAKAGLFGTQDYVIPLLASFASCKVALDRVRKLADTSKLDSAEVNAMYSRSLNDYLKRKTKSSISPHELRAVYVMTTYALLPKGKRPSLIGFIASTLGHVHAANASYYQRVEVENVHRWTTSAQPVMIPDDAWVVNNMADAKRVAGIQQLMLRKIKITMSSVRSDSGGTPAVIQRVIDNNADLIEEYNDSL